MADQNSNNQLHPALKSLVEKYLTTRENGDITRTYKAAKKLQRTQEYLAEDAALADLVENITLNKHVTLADIAEYIGITEEELTDQIAQEKLDYHTLRAQEEYQKINDVNSSALSIRWRTGIIIGHTRAAVRDDDLTFLAPDSGKTHEEIQGELANSIEHFNLNHARQIYQNGTDVRTGYLTSTPSESLINKHLERAGHAGEYELLDPTGQSSREEALETIQQLDRDRALNMAQNIYESRVLGKPIEMKMPSGRKAPPIILSATNEDFAEIKKFLEQAGRAGDYAALDREGNKTGAEVYKEIEDAVRSRGEERQVGRA